ncbi:MAG TPA: choice-of-anchor tandem repeat GloVer-containing protein [Rhizomicrobium sp.]|jgi:uncharacterized repeat protein (TIGR03803 family)|nr:choice-of-anchor tandem repeat GloVer-containing protein [Rhizomicrobium sp.]
MSIDLYRTALLGSVLALALSASGAQAGGFTVVHSFVGGSNDGAGPLGGVAPAGGGSLYVATDGGGSSSKGTLALIRKDGTSQVLHSFTGGSDGQNADGAPVKWPLDGNLYGTTQFGGASGCGTIYKYTPGSGAYQQIYAAGCAPASAFPFAGLSEVNYNGDDFLLGTGYNGGVNDDGALFFVTSGSAGSSCTSSFSSTSGSNPFAGIIQPTKNALYDYTVTTAGGSHNLGALVSISNTDCTATVLHNFAGGNDGAAPYGTLLYYKNALYGTTSAGGGPGLGTVFKVNPDGSNYTVLHAFQGIFQNSDGSFPHSGLTLNKTDGMLYGTTINGGNSNDLGTVFKINPRSGTETVVHAFSGSDGAHPYGNLYVKKGAIYGTTVAGGASNLGVVFKLKS